MQNMFYTLLLFCVLKLSYTLCHIKLSARRRALVFTDLCDFTKYSVPILKVQWKIFPTFCVAYCEAPAVKV